MQQPPVPAAALQRGADYATPRGTAPTNLGRIQLPKLQIHEVQFALSGGGVAWPSTCHPAARHGRR